MGDFYSLLFSLPYFIFCVYYISADSEPKKTVTRVSSSHT